jgi:hypothetical protein
MKVVLLVAAAAAAVAVGAALAQSGAKPLPGLPAYTAGYKGWHKLNRVPLPQRPSDAHPGTKNVFVSRRARSGRYPLGTVVVKEVFRKGQRFPYVIAVMRKTTARAHNGWQMIEWSRGSAGSRFSLLAQGAICYGCHVGAKRTDYVFTRDRNQ